jgi:hypothetical protein
VTVESLVLVVLDMFSWLPENACQITRDQSPSRQSGDAARTMAAKSNEIKTQANKVSVNSYHCMKAAAHP